MLRPQSLTDVIARVHMGEKFEFSLAEFIDEVNRCENEDDLVNMISDDPGLISKEVSGYQEYWNTYVGGIAEHIARLNNISIPEWTNSTDRMLKKAWFANGGLKSLNAMLVAESPLSFRRRFIFAEKNPLMRI